MPLTYDIMWIIKVEAGADFFLAQTVDSPSLLLSSYEMTAFDKSPLMFASGLYFSHP